MIRRGIYIIALVLYCATTSSQEMKLFSSEMMKSVPKTQQVVMSFLKRYFNDLPKTKQTTIETKMADDKVYFRKGKPSDLLQVCDTMPFSISLHDRYYEVEWQKAGESFVKIVFPAQYDLLLGMQQNRAQQKFKEMVVSSPKRDSIASTPTEFVEAEDNIFVTKSEHFELESLTDATYYYNKVEPVFDNQHMEQSAANLFHGLIPIADYRMHVEQSIYGMQTISYNITLEQWLNYCAEWNMKVFFAIEEVREDGVLALVIAQSKELGFNHLLSVVIPDKFIDTKDAVLKVRLTTFIPTHNVKDLYQKELKTHRKVKWQ